MASHASKKATIEIDPPASTRATAETEPPKKAARPAPVSPEAGAIDIDDFDIARDLALLARALRPVEGGRKLLAIFAGVSVAIIVIMVGLVRLNEWNGKFFDAISNKDMSVFVTQLQTFVVLVAILLALTVAQTFLQERLKFRLREWVSRHLLDEWLKPMRIYHLGIADDGSNPDQRIQEDTKILADYTCDLACGAMGALFQIVAFIGVLWALSSQVAFDILGRTLAIPGYMVWCALAYAAIGSFLTWRVGRPLILLQTERYAREADLRFSLVRAREAGESIALHAGEKDERAQLEAALGAVVDVMRRISTSLAQLTWITSGTSWLSIIVPMLVAAPAYFHGSLSLGGMIMVTGAFNQVQAAMRWFVDNFSKLADWRSAMHRIARFREALDNLPAIEEATASISRSEHPEGNLSFEGLRILRPDGEIVIRDASVNIQKGERVLIIGESGSGKSTLFRAIAGLWQWGAGTILTPPLESMVFLPQRPYLPLGSLRYALTYPSAAAGLTDEQLQAALKRCDLDELIARLDEEGRWDHTLSLGEQQRLAFARLLLHKPSWVFLDEATSALDQESQHRLMTLFDEDLKDTTVVSIGHRPDLRDYHRTTLQLVHDRLGDKLKLKPRPIIAPPPRWLKGVARLFPPSSHPARRPGVQGLGGQGQRGPGMKKAGR